jgi:hypothetical protein
METSNEILKDRVLCFPLKNNSIVLKLNKNGFEFFLYLHETWEWRIPTPNQFSEF